MNCLRMDLRRSIFCKKFVLIVMATLLGLFASTWNEFQSYTWWGDSTGMQGCVNILYNSLAYLFSLPFRVSNTLYLALFLYSLPNDPLKSTGEACQSNIKIYH